MGLTLTALASAGLIGMSLRTASPAFRVFNLAPLRALGKVSYGFYVYHFLFFYAWLQLLTWLGTRFHGVVLPGLIEIGSAFALTYLVSRVSFSIFESRFLRYKTRFEYDSERLTRQHAFAGE